MTELPEPLTPPECDLRGLEYMPLLGQHLFGSEFNARASDSEWRAGLTLWWAAWCQVPAASLPDDDVALCRFADLGRDVKLWKKLKANALHGWIKCADGRLYHPTLAKQALLAWDKRKANKEDRSASAERKAREREDRSRMFAELAAIGVTPEWNIKTSDLRALVTSKCSDLSRANVTDVTQPVTVTVTAKTRRDGTYIPFTDVNGDEPKKPDPANPPDPHDESKALWDAAKAYLGTKASGQIGRWIKEHGMPAVSSALEATKAKEPEEPIAFMAVCLRNGAEREAQKLREKQQAEAAFNRRFPERELSESDAEALMNPDEFTRWKQRKAARA